jgi:hypothetical protein
MIEISDQTAEEIRRFTDLVNTNLIHVPYPPRYEISTHWRQDLNIALHRAVNCGDPRVIVYHELNQVGFGDDPLNIIGGGASECVHRWFRHAKALIGGSTGAILEVGAGNGCAAWTFHDYGSKPYIIVDLPHALVFSHALLRAKFPRARFREITNADDAVRDDWDHDFVLCPVQLLQYLRIENLDLFLNTYSLGEMPQGAVDFVMCCVQDLKPRFIFSENIIFTDKTQHYDAGLGDANQIALPLRPMWRPEIFELYPEMIHQPYAGGDRKHRFIGTIGLALDESSDLLETLKLELRAACSAEEKLKRLYFLAMWDKDYVDQFVRMLGILREELGAPFDVNAIGEVKYLRA